MLNIILSRELDTPEKKSSVQKRLYTDDETDIGNKDTDSLKKKAKAS